MKKAILNLIEKVEAGAGVEAFVAVETLERDTLRHSVARQRANKGLRDDTALMASAKGGVHGA
ncbi:hypothetical protein AK973_4053 [Pseudomonas brassicacearum]|nr:hypothetical protein AK973_4053 [Pseudomonas brassicacearum]